MQFKWTLVLATIWVVLATPVFAAETIVSSFTKVDGAPPNFDLNYYEKDCEEECQIANFVCKPDHDVEVTLTDIGAKWVVKAINAVDHEFKIVLAGKSYPFLIRQIDYAGELTNDWHVRGESHGDNTPLFKELEKAKSIIVNIKGFKIVLPVTKEAKEWAVACQK